MGSLIEHNRGWAFIVADDNRYHGVQFTRHTPIGSLWEFIGATFDASIPVGNGKTKCLFVALFFD